MTDTFKSIGEFVYEHRGAIGLVVGVGVGAGVAYLGYTYGFVLFGKAAAVACEHCVQSDAIVAQYQVAFTHLVDFNDASLQDDLLLAIIEYHSEIIDGMNGVNAAM